MSGELPDRRDVAPLTGVAEHPEPVRAGETAADIDPDDDDTDAQ